MDGRNGRRLRRWIQMPRRKRPALQQQRHQPPCLRLILLSHSHCGIAAPTRVFGRRRVQSAPMCQWGRLGWLSRVRTRRHLTEESSRRRPVRSVRTDEALPKSETDGRRDGGRDGRLLFVLLRPSVRSSFCCPIYQIGKKQRCLALARPPARQFTYL